ncbi:MAG TPA: hypothetical protein VE964_15450 [Myxococcales bacterium]|nr:hypothetical protein [Myxococcales bacterium]
MVQADEEIPAGHFYFGFSAELAQPFGRALISRETLGLGTGGGLYAHYEGAHLLLGAEIAGGHFKNDDTYSNPFMIALRGGPVFGSGPTGFYVAAGPALLAFGAVGDDAAGATGLSGEVGVLFFRQLRWFRLTAFAQYNLPLWRSGSGKGDENVTSLSWAALGLRLQF